MGWGVDHAPGAWVCWLPPGIEFLGCRHYGPLEAAVHRSAEILGDGASSRARAGAALPSGWWKVAKRRHWRVVNDGYPGRWSCVDHCPEIDVSHSHLRVERPGAEGERSAPAAGRTERPDSASPEDRHAQTSPSRPARGTHRRRPDRERPDGHPAVAGARRHHLRPQRLLPRPVRRHPAARARTATPRSSTSWPTRRSAPARRTPPTSSTEYANLVYNYAGLTDDQIAPLLQRRLVRRPGRAGREHRTRRARTSRSCATRPPASRTSPAPPGPAPCSAPATPEPRTGCSVMDLLRHVGRGNLTSFAGGAPGNRELEQSVWRNSPVHRGGPPGPGGRAAHQGRRGAAALHRRAVDYIAGINAYIDTSAWPTATAPASTC